MITILPTTKKDIYKLLQSKKLHYISIYTILFAILSAIVFYPFIQENKSFIWKRDGLYQSYSSIAYLGSFYRTLLSDILNGNFTIPQFDFNVGFGLDILTTLNYYGLGDPLVLLSAFFPKENTELFYHFVILLRFYLSGLSFSYYCFYTNRKSFPTLIGAFSYAFCGFALFAGVRHPYFTNSMIYLPLLLTGVEKIFHKKSSKLFIVMVAVSAISNYYFFYMLTILTFLYIVIRFFDFYRTNWKNHFFLSVRDFIFTYLTGVGIASFSLLPTILAFCNNSRKSSFTETTALLNDSNFNATFYYSFFSSSNTIGSFTSLSFCSLCSVGVLLLFFKKRRKWEFLALKISFILFTFMALSPLAGKVMNGFSYSSNRWIFGYSFLVCFILVSVFDDILRLSLPHTILFTILFLFSYHNSKISQNPRFLLGCKIMIVTLILLWLFQHIKQKKLLLRILILFMVMLSIGINSYYLYSADGINYIADFHTISEAYQEERNTPESAITEVEDSEFGKVSTTIIDSEHTPYNMSLLTSYPDTNAYYSLMPEVISEFFADLELTSMILVHKYTGFDGISRLEALSSVKYFAVQDGDSDYVPYGYQELLSADRDGSDVMDTIYENMNALPIGYTYSDYMTESDFSDLTGIQRQQAMFQTVVLEDDTANMLSSTTKLALNTDVTYEEANLSYTVVSSDGIAWDTDHNQIQVQDKKSSLVLRVKALKNEELYLRLHHFDITNSGSDSFRVKVKCNSVKKEFRILSDDNKWGKERHNYLMNLGSSQEGTVDIKITFPNKGTFYLEDIEIYSLPLTSYEEQISELHQEVLENISMETNSISADITVTSDKMLTFSIPYSSGWSAKVDGEKVDIEKANIMYMAIPLTEGTHKVKLIYETPGLKVGFGISLFTILFVLLFYHIHKKRSFSFLHNAV